MTAVTVECDEKSVVNKAREWAHPELFGRVLKGQSRVLLTG